MQKKSITLFKLNSPTLNDSRILPYVAVCGVGICSCHGDVKFIVLVHSFTVLVTCKKASNTASLHLFFNTFLKHSMRSVDLLNLLYRHVFIMHGRIMKDMHTYVSVKSTG